MRRLAFLLVLLAPGIALAASPTAAEILAQSKAASGGALWDSVTSLQIKGKMMKGGLEGPADKSVDMTTGHSVSHFQIGGYRGGEGYDGTTGWMQAPSGEISAENSDAQKQAEVTQAYILARGYWFPDRWPAAINLLGTRSEGEDRFEVLQITPQGGDPFELWINAETHLVDRTVVTTPAGQETRSYNEYLSVNGVQIPFHQWLRDDQNHYTIFQYDAASVNLPFNAKDFAMPQQNLNDYAFLGGGNQATMPFQLIHNRVYLGATVGSQPLQLQLDSAAVNVLTGEAAGRLGVKSAGSFPVSGPQGQPLDVSVAKIDSMTLGGDVTLSNQLFRVVQLPGISDADGTRFDGFVGFELLKRFVVQVNYAYRKVTLILPGSFNATDAGTPVPFTLTNGRIPTVSATIDGISGPFAIDTGSTGMVNLEPAFVKTHDLLARYETTPQTTIGWGVGGAETGRAARAGNFAVGGVAMGAPVILLDDANVPADVGQAFAGVIGGALLRRFTLTFDYANQRIYLK
ncbi:MAG TPA: retropepsin-like aspartic protease, partial [Gammaproteobacteria bacterium]|nr:retropepsin-like aspartic protease [Gammaproteobacteria bacterium]